MHFSNYAQDTFVFPHLSKLRGPTVPSMPEMPNYFGSLVLNNIFIVAYPPGVRGMLLSMVRRTDHAVRQYNEAREALCQYVELLPQRNNTASLVCTAVSKFETAMVHAHAARNLMRRVVEAPNPEPGSDYDRLRLLVNRIKHFDDDFEVETGALAPVWLSDSGLHARNAELSYVEFHSILTCLVEDCRQVSEELPKERAQRARELADRATAGAGDQEKSPNQEESPKA